MTMITLPSTPSPNAVTPTMLDYGMILRPATGAAPTRINRSGSRFQVHVTYPPMKADTARPFVSRIQQAKINGLRMTYPLLGVSQGSPGTPLVNGSGAAGTSLPIKGLTVGYVIKEGYWLTVVDAAGVHYLHNVTANVTADGSGHATAVVVPALRGVFADGDTVNIAAPDVEGIVTSDAAWSLDTDKLISISFTLEEAA